MSRVAKKDRKKKAAHRLDKLAQWQAMNLGRRGGFSHRFIAALVFHKLIEKVSDEERACIASFLHRNDIKVTWWRDGRTANADAYARAQMKPTARERKALND